MMKCCFQNFTGTINQVPPLALEGSWRILHVTCTRAVCEVDTPCGLFHILLFPRQYSIPRAFTSSWVALHMHGLHVACRLCDFLLRPQYSGLQGATQHFVCVVLFNQLNSRTTATLIHGSLPPMLWTNLACENFGKNLHVAAVDLSRISKWCTSDVQCDWGMEPLWNIWRFVLHITCGVQHGVYEESYMQMISLIGNFIFMLVKYLGSSPMLIFHFSLFYVNRLSKRIPRLVKSF
jgi:hypothetical protein